MGMRARRGGMKQGAICKIRHVEMAHQNVKWMRKMHVEDTHRQFQRGIAIIEYIYLALAPSLLSRCK